MKQPLLNLVNVLIFSVIFGACNGGSDGSPLGEGSDGSPLGEGGDGSPWDKKVWDKEDYLHLEKERVEGSVASLGLPIWDSASRGGNRDQYPAYVNKDGSVDVAWSWRNRKSLGSPEHPEPEVGWMVVTRIKPVGDSYVVDHHWKFRSMKFLSFLRDEDGYNYLATTPNNNWDNYPEFKNVGLVLAKLKPDFSEFEYITGPRNDVDESTPLLVNGGGVMRYGGGRFRMSVVKTIIHSNQSTAMIDPATGQTIAKEGGGQHTSGGRMVYDPRDDVFVTWRTSEGSPRGIGTRKWTADTVLNKWKKHYPTLWAKHRCPSNGGNVNVTKLFMELGDLLPSPSGYVAVHALEQTAECEEHNNNGPWNLTLVHLPRDFNEMPLPDDWDLWNLPPEREFPWTNYVVDTHVGNDQTSELLHDKDPRGKALNSGLVWLTHHTEIGQKAYNPRLLEIGYNEYLLLFNRGKGDGPRGLGKVYAMVIDEFGHVLREEVYVGDAQLPKGDYLFHLDDKVAWVTGEKPKPKLGEEGPGRLVLNTVSKSDFTYTRHEIN